MIQFTPRRKQSGFSLIELLLVLGISIAISALWLNSLRRDAERGQGKAAGEQIKMVGQALNSYIALRYDAITSHVPGVDDCAPGDACETANPADPGSRVCVNVADLGGGIPGKRCTITNETLRINGLVPNSFSGRNSWGSTYTYRITVTGTNPNYQVDGMVVTDDAYTTGATVRFDLLGEAMLAAGADSGMTRSSPTQADGYNGSWSESNARFDNIDKLGQLVYRAGFSAQAYNAYLRRDGALPMTGDLDLDNHNIVDAFNINANGTIQGNKLVADSDTVDALIMGGNKAQIGTSGTGTAAKLSIRHGNKVTIENTAGDPAALESGSLRTGNLIATGAATFGPSGDATITTNGIIGGVALNVTDYVRAGGASIRNNQLLLAGADGVGTAYGLAFNPGTTTISLTGNSNLSTGGDVTALNVRPQNAILLGPTGNETMIFQSNPADQASILAGAACTNSTGTGGRPRVRIARANSTKGELVQCTDGIWTTMGLTTDNVRSVLATAQACTVALGSTPQVSVATCAAGEKMVAGGFYRSSTTTRGVPSSSYFDEANNQWYVEAGFTDPYGTGATAVSCWLAQAVCSK